MEEELARFGELAQTSTEREKSVTGDTRSLLGKEFSIKFMVNLSIVLSKENRH